MLLAAVLCLIPALIHQSLQANISAKCCPEGFEVEESNKLTLNCTRQVYSRFQFSSDVIGFFEGASDGECIDSEGDNFFIYKVNNSTVSSKTPTSTAVFPKCCPLRLAYNKSIHSCTRKANITEDFINSQMIKIGLPHCRTIIDHTFSTFKEAASWAEGLKPGSYCLDETVNDVFITRKCQDGMGLCEQKRCFKKCCSDGQSYVGGETCRNTYVHGLRVDSQAYSPYIEDIEDDYELIYGAGCRRVSLVKENKIQYQIKKHGAFSYYNNLTAEFMELNQTDLKSYCLEHASTKSIAGYFLFFCINEPAELAAKFSYTLWAKSVSCICLLVTIGIYFYMGEVKSSFGKLLINYCVVMICLMVTLMVTQLSTNVRRLECKIRAYLLIFFNMSAFTWINVMSLDIWWTFGTPRRTIGSDQRRKDLKIFFFYFFYGWGVPLCHTLMMLFFDSTKILPQLIQPYMGIYYCFIENRKGNYSRVVFLVIPQLIFQIINTILFIKTITYCIRVKNEMRNMNDSSRIGRVSADKERFWLIVKLAVIMGVVWSFEAVSAFFPDMKSYSNFTKILEIIFDTITCLQGVFIFLIFICKKKTFNNIKIKLGLGERKIASSTSLTQSSHLNGHYPMNKRQTTLSINDDKM